jgi:hypothetical protein
MRLAMTKLFRVKALMRERAKGVSQVRLSRKSISAEKMTSKGGTTWILRRRHI